MLRHSRSVTLFSILLAAVLLFLRGGVAAGASDAGPSYAKFAKTAQHPLQLLASPLGRPPGLRARPLPRGLPGETNHRRARGRGRVSVTARAGEEELCEGEADPPVGPLTTVGLVSGGRLGPGGPAAAGGRLGEAPEA